MRLQPLLTNFMKKRSYQPKLNLPSFCTIELLRLIIEANVWMFLSLGLALFVPEINYVVSPLGSLAAVFIFVLPGKKMIIIVVQSVSNKKVYNGRVTILIVICPEGIGG